MNFNGGVIFLCSILSFFACSAALSQKERDLFDMFYSDQHSCIHPGILIFGAGHIMTRDFSVDLTDSTDSEFEDESSQENEIGKIICNHEKGLPLLVQLYVSLSENPLHKLEEEDAL